MSGLSSEQAQELIRLLHRALEHEGAADFPPGPVRAMVVRHVLPELERAARAAGRLSRVCTNAACVGMRRQIRDVSRELAPALQPGGMLIDAVRSMARRSQQTEQQRDQYRTLVARANRVVQEHRRAHAMIHPETISQALSAFALAGEQRKAG